MSYCNFFKQHDSIESVAVYKHNSVSDDFTIVIPTYKRSIQLSETLESVFCQTQCEYSFNVIVLDNNPSRYDETELLMQNYTDKENLSYFKNSENLGMQGNWNRAFLLSKAKYTVLLHDDDLLHPLFMHYLKISLDGIKGHVSVLKPLENRWKDDGNKYCFEQIVGPARTTRIYDIENYRGFIIGAPTGCLFNTQDIVDIGGFSTELNIAASDVELIVRLGRKLPVYQIQKRLIIYRISVNAASNIEIQYLGVERCYQIVRDLLQSYHLPTCIINRFWCVYVKSWSENIKREFCPDFDYKTAIKRCGLKKYSKFEGYSSWIFIKFVETAYLAFHGKLRLMSLKFWIYKYLK